MPDLANCQILFVSVRTQQVLVSALLLLLEVWGVQIIILKKKANVEFLHFRTLKRKKDISTSYPFLMLLLNK